MKSNLFIAEHFVSQGCLNIDQGINLWHLLNHVIWAGIPGDIVELGCLSGRTAAMLAATLQEAGDSRQLWLYDSFVGLPSPTVEDGNMPFDGKMFATTPEEVLLRFEEFSVPPPRIIEGWFCDTLPGELPPTIAFAHLDGDMYLSTKQSLEAVYPRLAEGAIVVVDDYCDDDLSLKIAKTYNANPYHLHPYSGSAGESFPSRRFCIGNWCRGVKTACDEFLADKPEDITVLIAGDEKHGFFKRHIS